MAGIKLAGAFFRRPDMTREQCLRHYRENHGPLVRNTPQFRSHVEKYVQHDRIDCAVPVADADEAICGVTQLWYRDLASFSTAFATPDYSAVIRPDEHRFVDLSRSLIAIGQESAALPGGDDAPLRLFRFLSRKPDANEADFADFRRAYAVAAARDSKLTSSLAGYVQIEALPADVNPFEGAPSYAGLDEFRFTAAADITEFLRIEAAFAERLGARRFLDPNRSTELIANFRVVF
jgi:uncharacterized protein (TIGR02118 family)